MRTAVTTLTVSAALAVPAGAAAQTPAPGPWPAPVADAANPLLGTPFSFNGSNATERPRMRLWLPVGNQRRTALTRRVGGRTVLRGRVAGAYDRGIGGATLLIAQEIAGVPGWSVLTRTQSARNGRFHTVLAPDINTRRLAVLYWPTTASPAPIVSRRVLLRAGSRVYLKARTGRRRTVRFAGRVSGAPIPPGGLLVAIQVANGPRWPTVRLIHTTPDGRFTTRYRFRDRNRAYTVRASVPRQTGWPLYAGRSTTTRLRTR